MDMRPSLTEQNAAYCSLAKAVAHGQLSLQFPVSIGRTNGADIPLSDLRAMNAHTPRRRQFRDTACLTTFVDLVGDIVKVCSKEQVVGANTTGIVATVQNMEMRREWAERELIGNAVSMDGTVVYAKSPVALGIKSAHPRPTPVTLRHARPEPRGEIGPLVNSARHDFPLSNRGIIPYTVLSCTGETIADLRRENAENGV